MASIRVRLRFEPNLLAECKGDSMPDQCWMLVDTTRCKFVYDLEYLIRKKLLMEKKCFHLNLYLDDFLLPSKENIQIIRDNDVISVRGESMVKICTNNENPKKRKLDSSSDSKKEAKKMKQSPTTTKGDTIAPGQRLKNKCKRSTVSIKDSVRKSKRQKAVDFLHKISHEVSNKISGAGTASETKTNKKQEQSGLKRKDEQNSLKKDKTKPVQSQSSLGKKNTICKKDIGSIPVEESGIKEKTGNKQVNKSAKKFKSERTSSVVKDKKSVAKQSDSSVSVSSATSSSEESPSEDGKVVEKKTLSNTGGLNKPQTTMNVNGTVLPHQRKSASQGNHIRFDDVERSPIPPLAASSPANPPLYTTRPPILPLPNIPYIQHKNIPTADIQSPHLSPIHPISTTQGAKKPVANRQINTKKDVYTYKSTILESTRVESATAPVGKHPPQQKNFSSCGLLHGPPRVGDTIAYKILELSQSYTPEISKYKEGKVLAVDPTTDMLKLKLTKESFSRVQGDGHVSFKFELLEINEEDGEPIIPVVEIPDEVDVKWSAMIEPRLVAPGN